MWGLPDGHYIEARGGISVVPKRNYGQDIDKESVDWCLYKYRHLIENAFARIKNYRSISTRYKKLARNYASMVSLAFSMMAADVLLSAICTAKVNRPYK